MHLLSGFISCTNQSINNNLQPREQSLGSLILSTSKCPHYSEELVGTFGLIAANWP